MDSYAEIVVVDLRDTRSSDDLFTLLGETFELGGPDGNVPVNIWVDGRGWGWNWDALLDCLGYLDSGGIWGTSRKRRFPLLIRFIESSAFREDRDGGYSVFVEILESVKGRYAANQLRFDYVFE